MLIGKKKKNPSFETHASKNQVLMRRSRLFETLSSIGNLKKKISTHVFHSTLITRVSNKAT